MPSTPRLLLATLLATATLPPHAQTQSATSRPTKMEPIAQSMAQLLDGGYEITAISAGMAGFGFVLRRGKQWVLCTMGVAGDPPHGQTTSDCGKLN
jgi:hypothetical protein